MLKYIKDRIQGKAPKGAKRSPRWRTVRKEHFEKFPFCCVCGGKKNLEVHHIQPFHMKQELELNSDNLITLCESKGYGVNCHLWFGHLGNYRNCNPSVVDDVAHWMNKRSS